MPDSKILMLGFERADGAIFSSLDLERTRRWIWLEGVALRRFRMEEPVEPVAPRMA